MCGFDLVDFQSPFARPLFDFRKWACRFMEAIVGFEWVVMIAVWSAYVLRIVLVVSGMSAVYNVYRNGPRILPWGTLDWE